MGLYQLPHNSNAENYESSEGRDVWAARKRASGETIQHECMGWGLRRQFIIPKWDI